MSRVWTKDAHSAVCADFIQRFVADLSIELVKWKINQRSHYSSAFQLSPKRPSTARFDSVDLFPLLGSSSTKLLGKKKEANISCCISFLFQKKKRNKRKKKKGCNHHPVATTTTAGNHKSGISSAFHIEVGRKKMSEIKRKNATSQSIGRIPLRTIRTKFPRES